MGISKINKIKKIDYKGKVYDLSFNKDNRFFASSGDLSDESLSNVLIHNSPPDIDIDFQANTDHITDDFLLEKYGKERVLSVSTLSTFNEKGCLKDVVRAIKGPEETGFSSDVFQVTKEMPNFLNSELSLKEWFEQWPDDPNCSERVRKWIRDPENKEIIDITLKLQGQIRAIGQHAAGVVVTPSECWNHIPTNIIPKNQSLVTAFQEADRSGKDLSELGILKLDRLKLSTLNVIAEAIENIKKHKGEDAQNDIDFVDINDPNLYKELRKGINHGVFQFESPGMNRLIKDIHIEKFEELTAAAALYRPGPMGIGADREYVYNKYNPNKIQYVHPALKPILKETNGVLVFQEQLMFIANQIGGMSLGDGDMLRRAMDKGGKIINKETKGEVITEKEKNDKNYKNFQKYWNKFLEGAKEKGFTEDEVNKIKEWVIKYVGYSFNKCLTKDHTIISKERGRINLLDVNIGEEILGYNTKKEKNEYNKVKNIHKNGKKKIYKIKTSSGKVLKCTLDHKIMTNKGMKTLGEAVRNYLYIKIYERTFKEEFEEITEIEEIDEQEETFDLEIESKDHNFYANDICVSNSHSVSYSYIAAQTLYIKHYYPTEFYTALLNHPKTSGSKEEVDQWIKTSIASAMLKGISILPPSIDRSGWGWEMVDDNTIIMGYSSIDHMGKAAYDEMLDLVEGAGKDLSTITMAEFFELPFSAFNKQSFEACVKAGVFDKWSNSRDFLFEMWQKRKKKKKNKDQLQLFDSKTAGIDEKVESSKYPETSKNKIAEQFFEVCNFNIEEIERITNIKNEIKSRSKVPIESINNFSNDGWYFFVLHDFEKKTSKKGSEYLTLKVGDGISIRYLRAFEPLSVRIFDHLERGEFYISKFKKNKKGFINFEKNAKFIKFKKDKKPQAV